MTAAWMVAGPLSLLATGLPIETFGLRATLGAVTAGWVALALVVLTVPATRRLDESRVAAFAAPGAAAGR